MGDVWQDIRFAVRSLRSAPAFSAVAVLVLALGIGAATAMSSVLQGLLLKPFPAHDPDGVVVLWTAAPARSSDRLPVSYADLRAFGESARTASGAAGVSYHGTSEQVLVDAEGRAVVAAASWVTGDLLGLLGVAPAEGRLLLPLDDEPGAAPVMVISHAFRERHFGRSGSAVGQVLERNGRRATVVGVLPRGFDFPRGADIWLPVLPDFPATLEAGAHPASVIMFDMVVRLVPGATAAHVAREFDAFLAAGDEQRPAALRGTRAQAASLHALVSGDIRTTVWAAVAAVGLLLLLACVNVANLLLVRGSARVRELAIRSALGAGRTRLVRQLLTESTVLAALGGVAGAALAFAAVGVLARYAPPGLPRRDMLAVDGTVLVAALATAALTVLLAGLLPAVLAARGSGRLYGPRVAGADHGATSLRHVLVTGQVSLAVIVVVAAGLLVRSLDALQRVDMGFNDERLLVLQTALPPDPAAERSELVTLQELMLERVAAIPGVRSVTALPVKPFSGQGGWSAMYMGEGQTAEEQQRNPWVNFEIVAPGYLATMEMPLKAGREFTAGDREETQRVAIISEAVARAAWPGLDPLGRRIRLGGHDAGGEWHTVVGVVGETRYRDLLQPQPSLYLPVRQFGGPVPMTLAIRTTVEPATVREQAGRALLEVHPQLRLAGGGPITELLATPLARPRFATLVLSWLAGITLLLALVGIHGTLAATVRQRQREMGLRMALGARGGAVRALVLKQGMRLVLLGCVLGSVAAWAASRLLRSLLFGVEPGDPLTFAAVVVLVIAASAVACYVPALRASRVEPSVALRAET